MDLFSEILQTLKLRGTVYFHARFNSPWGMKIPSGEFANFHIVTAGECWIKTEATSSPVILQKGDMVLFPRGDSHSLADSLGSDIITANELLSGGQQDNSNEIVFGGNDSFSSALICGHF